MKLEVIFMKKLLLTFTLIILTVLCSCAPKSSLNQTDEIYNFETDVQHYYNPGHMRIPVTASEEGYYYVVTGGLVIYVDKETMQGTPLCNKANCLHKGKETCNGYLLDAENYDYFGNECFQRMIQYYEGHIYTVDSVENLEKESYDNILFRYNLDGTNRTKVTGALKEKHFLDWFIHRGYFYYASDKCLSRIPMNNPKGEEEVLYELESYNETSNNFRDLDAYGDYIYFNVTPYNKETDTVGSEDYRININTLEAKLLLFKGENIAISCFVNGKIIIGTNTKEDYTRDFYITDMNFENEKFLLNTRAGNSVLFDGKYIYVDNANRIWERDVKLNEPIGQEIQVYDFDANPIDTILLPCDTVVLSMGGQDENCFIFGEMDYSTYVKGRTIEEYDLYYLDKAQIGSLNGKYAKINKITKFGWKEYILPDYVVAG